MDETEYEEAVAHVALRHPTTVVVNNEAVDAVAFDVKRDPRDDEGPHRHFYVFAVYHRRSGPIEKMVVGDGFPFALHPDEILSIQQEPWVSPPSTR